MTVTAGQPAPTPSCAELDLAHDVYLAREPRDLFYRVALQLLESAHAGEGEVSPAEALAVLLTVWNVQYYRMRPAEKLSLVADLETLLEHHRSELDTYRHRTVDSLGAAEREGVEGLFESFREVLGPVGAAKALHLLAPGFFALWDQAIRSAYGVASNDPARHADCYSRFMEITRQQAAACGGEAALGRNPVKALDEYNYCRFTLKAEELN